MLVVSYLKEMLPMNLPFPRVLLRHFCVFHYAILSNLPWVAWRVQCLGLFRPSSRACSRFEIFRFGVKKAEKAGLLRRFRVFWAYTFKQGDAKKPGDCKNLFLN